MKSTASEHRQLEHFSLLTASPAGRSVRALADLLDVRSGHRSPFPFSGRSFTANPPLPARFATGRQRVRCHPASRSGGEMRGDHHDPNYRTTP